MLELSGSGHLFDVEALPGDEGTSLKVMYRALVEQIPAILYINGPQEHSPTLYVSPQTETILGLPRSGWFDNTWSTHVHPDDLAKMNANYTAFLRDQEYGVDEYRFVKPDGEVIWIHDSLRIIRDDAGEPAFVQGVMFDVTDQKRALELLDQRARLIERIEQVGRRFTELLLAGGELQDIMDALVDIVANPVAFEDAAHQLIGYAPTRSTGEADLLASWVAHSRLPHPREPSHCTWAPVRLREEEWGRLHVMTMDAEVDEIDALAVDRAAAAIGLWLLSGRERLSLVDRARSELIADLWQGRRWNAGDVLARSRTLGGGLDRPVLVAIAVEVADDVPLGSGPRLRRVLEACLDDLRQEMEEAELPGMAAVIENVCLAIIGLAADGPVRAVIERVGQSLHALLREHQPGRIISVGISRAGTVESLRRTLTEAADAAAHGLATGSGGVHHVADLGLRHLLARLGDGPLLSQFVEDELGGLLAHDARDRASLLPTLTAYIDSGCQKAAAARALHIERRSLYYRLGRIETLLGVDLNDASVRLRLQVALQGLDVLRQRRGVASSGLPGPDATAVHRW